MLEVSWVSGCVRSALGEISGRSAPESLALSSASSLRSLWPSAVSRLLVL